MTKLKKTFSVVAVATLSLGLASCGEAPMPPVDGIQQARQDDQVQRDKKTQESRQLAQQQAAQDAQAQQTGIIEGGPSGVSVSERLQFLQSQDITVEYSNLTYDQMNDQAGELVVPANSRALTQGKEVSLASVPKLYLEGQMLPEADLNGLTITILKMEMRQGNLVLHLLSKNNILDNPENGGLLTLKAPGELKETCEEAPGVDCSGKNLFGRNWTGKNYDGIIVRNANATNLTAAGTSLVNSDFTGAQLYRGNFLGANLTGAKFHKIKGQSLMVNSDGTAGSSRRTKAVNADFSDSFLYRCVFDYTDLTGANFDRADAQNCTFDNATMKSFRAADAWLHRLKASDVDLEGAVMPRVRMSQGTLAGSNLKGSMIAGGLLDRVEAKDADFTSVTLTGKDCTMAQAYLDGAKLDGMQASGCTFPRVSLKGASLQNFQGANADFTFADAKKADFTKANLVGANFFNADTEGANFKGAVITGLTCPNGDVVGKTAYGTYATKVVTDCSWDDPRYSISGREVFSARTYPAGKLLKSQSSGVTYRSNR